MKAFGFLALASAVVGSPIAIRVDESAAVVARQLDRTSLTENEFSQLIGGGCKPVIFVWARGSTELGNMVWSPRKMKLQVLTGRK
jgi:cutinase